MRMKAQTQVSRDINVEVACAKIVTPKSILRLVQSYFYSSPIFLNIFSPIDSASLSINIVEKTQKINSFFHILCTELNHIQA